MTPEAAIIATRNEQNPVKISTINSLKSNQKQQFFLTHQKELHFTILKGAKGRPSSLKVTHAGLTQHGVVFTLSPYSGRVSLTSFTGLDWPNPMSNRQRERSGRSSD
uniref:Uncharacterized protein n=1 Tax=Cacopsylla melanoneura TaxID=428564 RepID=A0A8D9BI09_9HEMI